MEEVGSASVSPYGSVLAYELVTSQPSRPITVVWPEYRTWFIGPCPTVTRLPPSPVYPLDNLTHFHVTDAAVLAALKAVSPYKACGPDNISARIVAECAEELTVPLAILCRASVSSGVFPKRWKSANIVPIKKKGTRSFHQTIGRYHCFHCLARF